MSVIQKTKVRQGRILTLVNEQRFITVEKLSEILEISVASVRRDLIELSREGKIERTHGGVAALKAEDSPPLVTPCGAPPNHLKSQTTVAEQVDALIMTIIDPQADVLLVESFKRRNKPVIAESQMGNLDVPVVTVDNYRAGYDIGCWAANYAAQHWGGNVNLLDLTYHLENTQERSKGFLDGIRSVMPGTEEVLKLNTQSNMDISYQLTRDALVAYPHINIIFAINDTNALGALRACEELNISPEKIMIIPFGIEGNTFCELIYQNQYVKAGIAMFPDVVGRTCLQAVLKAISGQPLQERLTTPYAVLTRENLGDYYQKVGGEWVFKWDRILETSALPIDPFDRSTINLPAETRVRVGFVVRYKAHEWYQNLVRVMQADAERYCVTLDIIEGDQTIKYELSQRRSEIASEAVKLVRSGSVILLDGGVLTQYFAQKLTDTEQLTGLRMITNSLEALNILQGNPNITVVCTGGVLRRERPNLVGPTAESSLQNLRADQVFLTVSGISPAFGLSHDDVSEVSIKQAMMRAAREVILLADHTCFGKESFIHFAQIKNVNKIVTDETLPASFRLELAQQGIEVIVAK